MYKAENIREGKCDEEDIDITICINHIAGTS